MIYPSLHSDPKNIRSSGMIALVKNQYLHYGTAVEDIALEAITKRYNVKKYKQHNGKYYYAHALREFVDPDLIFEVYGLRFEEKIPPFELIDEAQKDTSDLPDVMKMRRVKQLEFRENILINYSEQCSITKEATSSVLEAAHIQGYINQNSHHPQNGILLRVDFHKLFDKGLITISDDYILSVSPDLQSDYYRSFHGKQLSVPNNPNYRPSINALRYHRKKFLK